MFLDGFKLYLKISIKAKKIKLLLEHLIRTNNFHDNIILSKSICDNIIIKLLLEFIGA